jgi:hypothetical protein
VVVDGVANDLVLNTSEARWLGACWLAAACVQSLRP